MYIFFAYIHRFLPKMCLKCNKESLLDNFITHTLIGGTILNYNRHINIQ